MARIAVGAVFGILVGMTLGAACGTHAQSDAEDTAALADSVGLDPTDLAGALSSQPGVDARAYLRFLGVLPSGAVVSASGSPPLSGRLACIARVESRNDPNATNRYSGAMGLFQFLPSTWRSTPQGRAGLSAYDPAAATAAAEWMIRQGRIREWVPVQLGMC